MAVDTEKLANELEQFMAAAKGTGDGLVRLTYRNAERFLAALRRVAEPVDRVERVAKALFAEIRRQTDEDWPVSEELTLVDAELDLTALARAAIAGDNRIARLKEGLAVAWKHAAKMRNASKLVGPYPGDPKLSRVWERALYHEGKELMEALKPFRAALEDTRDASN